jgi:4-amino-4-deoxy-L-arabinose transferase-like glycosyltransferase
VLAWNLAQGKGYVGISPDVRDEKGNDLEHVTAYRPPVTPFIFAANYAVVGHSYTAIRVGEAVFGGLATLLVFQIAARVFSRPAGWLAGAVYAVYPLALYYNPPLLSETHGSLLILLFVWCCVLIRSARNGWWAVAAGLSLGLLLLCKPGYVFLFPFLLVWAGAVCRVDRRLWLRALLIPILAAAVVLPWVVRNYLVFGVLSLGTGGGSLLLQANNRLVVADPSFHGYAVWDTSLPEYADKIQEPNDEVKRDAIAKAYATAWLKANPDLWFYLVRGKIWRLFTPHYFGAERRAWVFVNYVVYLPILVLALATASFMFFRWLRQRDSALILLVPILATIAIAAVFHGQHRYRFPIDSLLIVLAAGGVVELTTAVIHWRRGSGRLFPRLSLGNMLMIALVFAAWVGWMAACGADNARIDAWRAEIVQKRVAAIEVAVEKYRASKGQLPTHIEDLVPGYLPNAESLHSPTHTLSYLDYQQLGSIDRRVVSEIASYTVEPAPDTTQGFRIVQNHGLPGR